MTEKQQQTGKYTWNWVENKPSIPIKLSVIEGKVKRIERNLCWPYVLPENPYFTASGPSIGYLHGPGDRMKEEIPYAAVKRQHVPPGELVLQRDARVEAIDGYIGQVDELLINSKDMQVTHLVLLVWHIFEGREITIPVSQIDHIDQGTIYLKFVPCKKREA